MAKILLVEDDIELTEKLSTWFKSESHVVDAVSTGEDALQLLSSFTYDLIVLDWGLPGLAGVEVCKRFRADGGQAPILFITGKGEIDEKETGLDSGADDYLVKPFEMRELAARMRSLLRRPFGIRTTSLNIAGVEFEPEKRTIKKDGASQRLMPKESALLEFLMRHPDRDYSSKALLNAVWPADADASEETVRTCIYTLRQKLTKLGSSDLIKTLLGAGYRIDSK
jgi:DNA-binding response OmpR family regulator